MTIEYFPDIVQGSDEWRELRRGIPTASNFSKVLAAGDGITRTKYMKMLAQEALSGFPRAEWHNADMDRGIKQEPELRAAYELETGHKTTPVGFVRSGSAFGPIGCSPDALLGDDGIIEIKSCDDMISIYDRDRIPPEHIPQCQGSLLVTGRKFCVLVIGSPGMSLFHRRITRDTSYLARLSVALEQFRKELDAMIERSRNYGQRRNYAAK